MILRAWMVALTGLCLMLTNVSVGATTTTGHDPVDVPTETEVAELVEALDLEFVSVINELGGTLAICPACPPGTNCCTANCILTCCTVACPPGSLPDCSCAFGNNAKCVCKVPPPPQTAFTPTLICEPEDATHTYVLSGTIRIGVWHVLRPTTGITQFNDGNYLDDCGTSASSVAYASRCGQYPWTDPITGLGWCDGIPADFDGESEWSIGGGFFPGGPWAADTDCDYGIFPHHGSVPSLDDVAYPLLGAAGAAPAFSWGADDTGLGQTGDLTADAGSGKIPSTDPSDQTIVGGDGQQCLTSGSITPSTDPDDWLDFCVGEAPTVCAGPGRSLDGAKLGGGDGGFVAFTVTAVTQDLGIGDWIVFPLPPGGFYHNHGGYHPGCDPTVPGYNPLADTNGDTWPDLFCHSPIDQDGDTVADVPTELYVTVAGEISS